VPDEVEKITPQVILEDLKGHFGEFVIRDCYHKGDSGVIVEARTGQMFVVAVAEVRGVIVR
jgi:hypothetical protein